MTQPSALSVPVLEHQAHSKLKCSATCQQQQKIYLVQTLSIVQLVLLVIRVQIHQLLIPKHVLNPKATSAFVSCSAIRCDKLVVMMHSYHDMFLSHTLRNSESHGAKVHLHGKGHMHTLT